MKKISNDKYLMALGLFTLAADHYRQMRQAEFMLNGLLHDDRDFQGKVSDAIYADKQSSADFLTALKYDGIEVEKP
jgi:hypothetical protein